MLEIREMAHKQPGKRFHSFIALTVLLLGSLGATWAQGPASRPILFVHGICGSAYDFEPLISPLYGTLDHTLYPTSTVFYAQYDSVQNKFLFWTIAGSLAVPWNESSIPANARFFSIQLNDPVGDTVNATSVAKISVLNKAYEVSQVIKQIVAITHIKDVIVVAHSMGGLDTRAYIENLASPGACYNYYTNQPAYNASTCTPGCTSTSSPSCPSGYTGAAYAGDVGDLITVDTPHLGSPLASLSLGIVGIIDPSAQCIADSSTNKTELELKPIGGSGLIEALNYDEQSIAGQFPIESSSPIQAVEDYFSDVTSAWDQLNGESDDVVQQPSQSIVLNVLPSHTSAPLQDVKVPYLSSDSAIASTSDCWIFSPLPLPPGNKPMLHYMTCLGNLPDTQAAIAKQIVANEKGTPVSYVNAAPATSITSSGATINETVNPDESPGFAYIQWSTNSNLASPTMACLYQDISYCAAVKASTTAQTFTTQLTGLPTNTVIYYQAVFYNTAGQIFQYGAIQNFKTLLPSETATATSPTSSGATVNETVNPEGSPGYAYIQWSTNSKLASPTMACLYQDVYYCSAVKVNDTAQAFTTQLTGLPTNTTIYYQAVFFNTGNNTNQYGAIQNFKTLLPVATVTATSPTSSGATVNETVNPEGSPGYAYIQWSTNSKLASPTMSCLYQDVYYCSAVKVNDTAQVFTTQLTGLPTNTTIYYQAVFFNTGNSTYQYGAIQNLKTLLPSESATAISPTSSGATVNETVNPEGSPGYAYIQWSTNSKLASPTMACLYQDVYYCSAVKVNDTAQVFTTQLTGLPTNTTIYYQAVFFNTGNGTYQYGAIQNFKTLFPVVITGSPTSIASNGATVSETVNPEGSAGYAYIQWSTNSKLVSPTMACLYQEVYYCSAVKVNYTAQAFTTQLTGLPANTPIYYQAVYFDTGNNTYQYGIVSNFTTAR